MPPIALTSPQIQNTILRNGKQFAAKRSNRLPQKFKPIITKGRQQTMSRKMKYRTIPKPPRVRTSLSFILLPAFNINLQRSTSFNRLRQNIPNIIAARARIMLGLSLSQPEARSMLHKEKIKKKITALLEKANEVDLKLILIFVEGYLRKKRK